jgi:hypothetical protein
MASKIALVTFYTEGSPFDRGKDLSEVAQSIRKQCHNLFDYIIILSPSILERQDIWWKKVFDNQGYIDSHLGSQQRKSSINIPWININSLLWKPAILAALLAENSEIEEGTIIVYHDINAYRYPLYSANFSGMSAFFSNNMNNCSIAIVADELFPLFFDCKQEVLRKYLHSEAKTLCHRWAGCIAMKKNQHSRQFCRDWYNLTAIDENRSQITKYDNYPGFIWHSQEQSTLSVLYYLWKYRLMKGRHFKTVFTHVYRQIPSEWSSKDQVKHLFKSIQKHSKSFFVKSVVERLAIMLKGRHPSKNLHDLTREIPKILIGELG